MTSRDDSGFRLRMAATLLGKAREAEARGDWREAALFARGAIETAAKAVIACFTGVPRSHEPAEILEEAAASAAFPADLRSEASARVEAWRGYGMEQHILLSYGDERNRVDPWQLVGPDRAREAVRVAGAAVDFASRCRQAVLGGE